jgi:hypothetical protein
MIETSFQDFLTRVPPGTRAKIHDFAKTTNNAYFWVMPKIELHCNHCKGTRYFEPAKAAGSLLNKTMLIREFHAYSCRNCQGDFKTFSLEFSYDEKLDSWTGFKYGENPSFGPPTPDRALAMTGSDRPLFLNGRKCENQGMGVGAFVYYRRVVEIQKNKILDEVIRAATHVGSDQVLIDELTAAKEESQFTKAVDSIKHALPQILLINGHNPLKLLHSALSKGVHELSDAECLQIAGSVRVVLIELSERVAQAAKDEAEIKAALANLTK